MKPYKLINVRKGYADVWISLVGDFELRDDDYSLDGIGYVRTEEFVESSDFENDIVTYRTRWVPYLYTKVGRNLGYATRKEAIEAMVSIVEKRKLKE